ncbi:DUF1294 domain-containing protein [Sporomusa sphaeroides]|uniref:DUF1294 domain-containing protein n=1 Tax=Sporomusa sphaeroides DSM 2875 TaxID=1337886 RepID=A0ABM9VXA7_9FIRM|nr:DUF1294 domain-containing protein [Sporomusa sphaeroides]OLS58346.1 hypothetical protein SPSPH_18840 [Sporomusa sphaeroides DSM 2875]CVK17467.1 hypothetical protein SSPH_00099 [Sporomusa sphaeroides DSM 2875]
MNIDLPAWLILYFVWNVVAFRLVELDKERAKRKTWRIRERTFFFAALFFGAAGVLTGMYVYRHKTLHATFVIGMPVMLVINFVCGYYIYIIILKKTACFVI